MLPYPLTEEIKGLSLLVSAPIISMHVWTQRARKEAARDDAAVSDAHNDGVPQLFSFLNRAVGDGSEAAAVRRRSSGEDKSALNSSCSLPVSRVAQ